jgi:hypothetical protein
VPLFLNTLKKGNIVLEVEGKLVLLVAICVPFNNKLATVPAASTVMVNLYHVFVAQTVDDTCRLPVTPFDVCNKK